MVNDRDSKPTLKIQAVNAPRPAVPRPPPLAPSAAELGARDAEAAAKRQKSDAELEYAATLAGVIGHIKRLEAAVASQGSAQKANDDAHDQALVLITSHLGIESDLPPKMQRSIPPPAPNADPAAKPARPVLDRIDRRGKRAQIIQVVIAVGVIADVVREIIKHFSH